MAWSAGIVRSNGKRHQESEAGSSHELQKWAIGGAYEVTSLAELDSGFGTGS